MSNDMDLAASGVVVGMKKLTGSVQARVDIDVMLTEQPDMFNLMLLALAVMQKKPEVISKVPNLQQNELLSYYSIAGIHGLPSVPWDDVVNQFVPKSAALFGGYCPHGLLIFPTWHRPYLMLMEQTIYLNMVKIANQFNQPHRERYLKAADAFRLPYLDYFRARDSRGVSIPRPGGDWRDYDFRLPDVFGEPGINVKFPPLDTIQEISNPLYSFSFEEGGQLSKNDWNALDRELGSEPAKKQYSTTHTMRWAPTADSAEHNLAALNNRLNQAAQGGITTFFDLVNTKPYDQFQAVASEQLVEGDMTSDDGTLRGRGSIEGFHGNYHVNIGGFVASGRNLTYLGHMSNVPVAAFDPVFWFHHCQIDRTWELWRAFHPDTWFPEPENPQDKPESKKDLLPFYNNARGTFWTSDDTKDTAALGYTYDDFSGPIDQLEERLKHKYNWMRVKPNSVNITKPEPSMEPLYDKVHASYFMTGLKNPKTITKPVPRPAPSAATTRTARVLESISPAAAAAVLTGSLAVAPPPPPKIDPVFDREWYVDSAVVRSAADGPFTIFFFLALKGELPTDDVMALAQSPFLAGINHMFVASSRACDNCGNLEAHGQISSDTTPITPLLLSYLELEDNELESLRPEHVKPFLVKYLRWRVVFNGSEIKDPRELAQRAHLSIGVSAKIYHDDGSKTYEEYPDVVEEIKANASATAGV